MARITYPDITKIGGPLGERLNARVTPKSGNFWRVLALTPQVVEAGLDLSDALRRPDGLSARVRETIILRVGHLCRASLEVHHHERFAREAGIEDALIEATGAGSGAAGLSESDRFVMQMTEELVADKRLKPATLDRALAEFGAQSTMEMIMLAGFYHMVCFTLNSFAIETEGVD